MKNQLHLAVDIIFLGIIVNGISSFCVNRQVILMDGSIVSEASFKKIRSLSLYIINASLFFVYP